MDEKTPDFDKLRETYQAHIKSMEAFEAYVLLLHDTMKISAYRIAKIIDRHNMYVVRTLIRARKKNEENK